MTMKTLEEDFQKMGLSATEIRESLDVVQEKKADLEAEDSEDDFGDLDEDDFGYEDEDEDDLDDEEMDERVQRMKKGSAKSRKASKASYRQNKAKIKRKMKTKRKTSKYKRHQAKLSRAPKASGVRVRRVFDDVEDPGNGRNSLHESLMDELNVLGESLEREPASRFDEYVEAFNHIADLGELAAMRVMEEDEDAAADLVSVSLDATSVLEQMEEMGGALSSEEDDMLEEALEEALTDVGEKFELYNLLNEDEDEDEDGDELDEDDDDDYSDNPFLDAANGLREAKKQSKDAKNKALLKSKSMVTPKDKKERGKFASITRQNAKIPDKKGNVKLGKNVRDQGALLNYLRNVKAGYVEPGEELGKEKLGPPKRKKGKK